MACATFKLLKFVKKGFDAGAIGAGITFWAKDALLLKLDEKFLAAVSCEDCLSGSVTGCTVGTVCTVGTGGNIGADGTLGTAGGETELVWLLDVLIIDALFREIG